MSEPAGCAGAPICNVATGRSCRRVWRQSATFQGVFSSCEGFGEQAGSFIWQCLWWSAALVLLWQVSKARTMPRRIEFAFAVVETCAQSESLKVKVSLQEGSLQPLTHCRLPRPKAQSWTLGWMRLSCAPPCRRSPLPGHQVGPSVLGGDERGRFMASRNSRHVGVECCVSSREHEGRESES